jgi:L-seryl-tRNA(Ser) seleniumtransferase
MNRLPNTDGMKNEVVMEKAQRNSYDHAVEIAGGRIVEAGMGAGCQAGELEAAIGEKTAAVFFLPDRPGDLPLKTVVAIAHRHGVPVVVDGAGRLDDPSCLRSYSATGADLVVFSSGKWMAGPQAAGLIAGPRRLISAIALQHLDVDVAADVWAVPRELVPVEELPFIPRMGIGRGFKVGKEEIVGAVVALQLFARKDHDGQQKEWSVRLSRVVDGLLAVPCVKAEFLAAGVWRRGVPHVRIRIDEKGLGMTCAQFVKELHAGKPPIHPHEREVPQGNLIINPWGLVGDAPEIIVGRIREIVEEASRRQGAAA